MGKSRSPWRRFPFLQLRKRFRRSPLSKRILLIASVCVVYLIFVVSQVGSSQDSRKVHEDKYGHVRGLYHVGSEDVPLEVDTGTGFVVPTRSNVVYITLKSKRQKPANIRGTIRPKLRRKKRKSKSGTFTQLVTLERANQTKRNVALNNSWRETRDVNYQSVDINGIIHTDTDSSGSSIRIYSQKLPPWFTSEDVNAMRFLADAKVLRINKQETPPSVLIFEGETSVLSILPKHAKWINVCAGQCGAIHSPMDTTEVFAFHLDRVLGLNRTLPAVGRKFKFLHDAQPCPVVLWDASLHSNVQLTWGEYQHSLKQRCWHKNITPKSDSGCSTVHHYEWSKLALFDFLLQIHSRLDPSCCGFRPRVEDVCFEPDRRNAECRSPEHIDVENIVHREKDPRHLVFTNNKGFFDRNEDNLDFKLLEGIKELPAHAVSVLKSSRLREKLLQSLFIDQTYWESQGGRQGIDKLIDVIERRSKVLLTYINAHGVTVTAMNV